MYKMFINNRFFPERNTSLSGRGHKTKSDRPYPTTKFILYNIVYNIHTTNCLYL